MNYKDVFQLAENKGYKINYPNKSILTGDTLNCMVLLECTIIQKWLRDYHKIHIEISFTAAKKYIISICSIGFEENKETQFNSYESALLAGIEEALQLI